MIEDIKETPCAQRKNWKKSWRLLPRLYITLSSCRTKLRLSDRLMSQSARAKLHNMRLTMYNEQAGVCPHCGKFFDIKQMDMHHVLPYAMFTELRYKRENILLLCKDCHKYIHMNPYLNIQLIESKAKQLNIDLTQFYNHDRRTDNQTHQ